MPDISLKADSMSTFCQPLLSKVCLICSLVYSLLKLLLDVIKKLLVRHKFLGYCFYFIKL
jgi:hypothetical protein